MSPPAAPSARFAILLSMLATDRIAELAGLSGDELEEELTTLASHLYAGTCQWLELVAEVDRRGGWDE
jgi:hypothetical protein